MMSSVPHNLLADPSRLLLEVDPRCVCQPGMLELMRMAAGLSYQEVAALLGSTPDRVSQLLTGGAKKSSGPQLARILRVLWTRLPVLPPSPASLPETLTTQEAAAILTVKPSTMREAAQRVREYEAFHVGPRWFFPRDTFLRILAARCGFIPRRPGDLLTPRQVARALRVSTYFVYHRLSAGQIRAVQAHPHAHWRIHKDELRRLLHNGADSLRQKPGRKRRIAS